MELTKPPLASGVVVKFQSKPRRSGERSAGPAGPPPVLQKMRRDFFEHDTRNLSRHLNVTKKPSKWAPKTDLNSNQVVAQVTKQSPGNEEKCGETASSSQQQMNSKARRAAKFREMKVLQKIMLSKEVNFSLANLKPALLATNSSTSSSCCCHCACNNSAAAIGALINGQCTERAERGGGVVKTCEVR